MQQCEVVNDVQTKPQPQVQVVNWPKRVGLYGGTFNPVHNAHLFIADQVGHTLCLDRVDLMPDAKPPHVDKKKAISGSDRLAMLKLAVADNPYLGVETAELDRGGVSYTYDTIKALIKQHPDTEYYFIIGGDMVDYLEKWYRIDDLIKLPHFHFVGVHRFGSKNESAYPVIWVDLPQIEFSSSDIRQRISHGQSIKYMVPKKVEQYIKEHQLYSD